MSISHRTFRKTQRLNHSAALNWEQRELPRRTENSPGLPTFEFSLANAYEQASILTKLRRGCYLSPSLRLSWAIYFQTNKKTRDRGEIMSLGLESSDIIHFKTEQINRYICHAASLKVFNAL